jgi:hypothetical protein
MSSQAPLPSECFPYIPPRYTHEGSRHALMVAQARIALREAGITGPVRYEHDYSDDDSLGWLPELEGGLQGPWPVPIHRCRCNSKKHGSRKATRKAGKRIYSQEHRCRKRGTCLVTQLENGGLACSHPGWKAGTICWHIRYVLRQLGRLSGPYAWARRRKPPLWLFEQGPSEETRRRNARRELDERVPQILFALCKAVEQPRRRGRKGLPKGATIYALCRKLYWNVGYETLVARLAKDPYFLQLAPNFRKKPPCIQTFCARFAQIGEQRDAIDSTMDAMITRCFAYGRELDDGFLMDADHIPTIPCDNSRDRKFGGPLASFRKKRVMVKRHLLLGQISNLVGATNVTLDYGLGSNDSIHLPTLARRAALVAPNASYLTADQQYTNHRNYRETENLGLELYIPEKLNEDRLNDEDPWPPSARRITKIEREDPRAFKGKSRRRSKIEGVPSSMKRRNDHLRLKARKNDPQPVYPELPLDNEGRLTASVSRLSEELIEALIVAAQIAVGGRRRNESLATVVLHDVVNLVTLEHLFDQRVNFDDPQFAFHGIRLVSEGDLKVLVKKANTRPSDDFVA